MTLTYRNELTRKALHISSLWMVAAIHILPRNHAILLFAILLSALALYEYARRHITPIRLFFAKSRHSLLRSREKIPETKIPEAKIPGAKLTRAKLARAKLTGAFHFCLAAFLVVLLFPKPIAITALTIMILGDTAAALFGRKYPLVKKGDKSLGGACAFFAITALFLFISGSLWQGVFPAFMPENIILIAFFATAVEFLSDPGPLDDNLTIPLSTGALMLFLA